MYVTIHILDGGRWEGQYAFEPWRTAITRSVKVHVPAGSRLVTEGVTTMLRTPDDKLLTASKVHTLCRVGVVGFDQEDHSWAHTPSPRRKPKPR